MQYKHTILLKKFKFSYGYESKRYYNKIDRL